mmetsp:Transcript_25604/g.55765  ORF Transcript_25604/g.55765 Transcript_25604/m.55765 type:complete len:234 (-) Transcript_25604:361-1062(-)
MVGRSWRQGRKQHDLSVLAAALLAGLLQAPLPATAFGPPLFASLPQALRRPLHTLYSLGAALVGQQSALTSGSDIVGGAGTGGGRGQRVAVLPLGEELWWWAGQQLQVSTQQWACLRGTDDEGGHGVALQSAVGVQPSTDEPVCRVALDAPCCRGLEAGPEQHVVGISAGSGGVQVLDQRVGAAAYEGLPAGVQECQGSAVGRCDGNVELECRRGYVSAVLVQVHPYDGTAAY